MGARFTQLLDWSLAPSCWSLKELPLHDCEHQKYIPNFAPVPGMIAGNSLVLERLHSPYGDFRPRKQKYLQYGHRNFPKQECSPASKTLFDVIFPRFRALWFVCHRGFTLVLALVCCRIIIPVLVLPLHAPRRVSTSSGPSAAKKDPQKPQIARTAPKNFLNNWRVPNPPGANPRVAERAPWQSSQSGVEGSTAYWKSPTDSCHFPCTCDTLVTFR